MAPIEPPQLRIKGPDKMGGTARQCARRARRAAPARLLGVPQSAVVLRNMNAPAPSSGNRPAASGQRFAQQLVTREPVYDRRLKVHRPRKKKGKGSQPKFL